MKTLTTASQFGINLSPEIQTLENAVERTTENTLCVLIPTKPTFSDSSRLTLKYA